MESSSDVSVVSLEKGSIELRLTTYVPNVDDRKDVPEQESEPSWEHNLHIEINEETMEIKQAEASILNAFFPAARSLIISQDMLG